MGAEMSCFFCGKSIQPDEILFVDNEWTLKYQDDEKNKVFSNFLEYPVTSAYQGLYHPVVKENATYEQGIPIELVVDRADGMIPAEVDEYLKRKRETAGTKADGPRRDDRDALGDLEDAAPVAPEAFVKNLQAPAGSEQKPESQPGYFLQNRACPHCRSTLPDGFGVVPVRHIVMAGGRASGKTSFLINALQQLNGQLSHKDLGTVQMVPESELYYSKLINQYVESKGSLHSTKLDTIKGLCPLYYRFRGAGANYGKECFFAIHDIAGEGFRPEHSSYIRNHRGIRLSEAMLLIIDPHQLRYEFHDNPAGKKKDEAFAYYETVNSFLTNSIRDHLRILREIKRVVVVVTKLDVPLTEQKDLFDAERFVLLRDSGETHRGYVDLDVFRAVEKELLAYLDSQGIKDIKGTIRENFEDHAPDEIIVTGVSTYTLKHQDKEVVFVNEYQDTAPKYRIIEPLLYLMASMGALEIKRPPAPVAPKTQKRRLFQNKRR